MRLVKDMGQVQARQLPARRGYALLMDVRALLNRIDAKTVGDILMGAESSELDAMYENLAFECAVRGEPLLGNEDQAFEISTDMYWFIHECLRFNFDEVWDAECVQPNHTPEFTPVETKMMPPFFAGVIYEKLATHEQLDTYYTVFDIAEMNELLVVNSNNEYTANKKAEGSSNTSSSPLGGLAGAVARARGP